MYMHQRIPFWRMTSATTSLNQELSGSSSAVSALLSLAPSVLHTMSEERLLLQ